MSGHGKGARRACQGTASLPTRSGVADGAAGTAIVLILGHVAEARVVQEHLRHADIQTTTVYTRLTQHELQQAVSVFDEKGN